MEPFKVCGHLRDMTSPYPDAALIVNAGKAGGDNTRHAIARQWLSEGIPYAFKDCPGVYESVRLWLSLRLDVDPKEINLTGSARLGQSLSPKKLGKPFGDTSDLDIFVISASLFERLKSEFDHWAYAYEIGELNASNATEDSFWKKNLEGVPKNIYRGFIDSKFIPNYERYKAARSISNSMYLLKHKLDVTPLAPSISDASVRCYNSWESYVRQVSLSLK